MNPILIYSIDIPGSLDGRTNHLLVDPVGVSASFIRRAIYDLPQGYHVAESESGEMRIFDKDNKCHPLFDSQVWGRNGGHPCIGVDGISTRLAKIRDLPWGDIQLMPNDPLLTPAVQQYLKGIDDIHIISSKSLNSICKEARQQAAAINRDKDAGMDAPECEMS